MRIERTEPEILIRKYKALSRELRQRPNLLETRIAVLGGSTTNEMVSLLELLLLDKGIQPTFYQSEYNRYFEEATLDSSQLVAFRPDIACIFTSSINIETFPPLDASEADLIAHVGAEVLRFATIWNALEEKLECLVIQNNFELPGHSLLGNFDFVSPGGLGRFIRCVNKEFSQEANLRPKLLINDLQAIAAKVGLQRFHDPRRWFSYKLISTPEGNLEIAKSIAAIVGSVYGRSRKCLVLDLDNTLWGGVIGDDGPERIKIGKETAEAEAFTAFQQYCLRMRERGIILAICSKNTESIARQGFEHPDSVLKLHHFAAFKANWEPKHENIRAIASELNIGLDSLVFVDDNPAEREIVGAQLPMVAVPDLGSDVTDFIRVLDEGRYFEPVALSKEDLNRAAQYESNSHRLQDQSRFATYEEYLDSLEMTAEIAPFKPVYMDRIAQLINKTNQFNLTTRRYTLAEVETITRDSNYITLYGRLADKFGDNGLISVIIARQDGRLLHIDLWLMSCRVLKRDMELAMLDALVTACRSRNVDTIRGYYLRTRKNDMVSGHYEKLGFENSRIDGPERSEWKLSVGDYTPRNKRIRELVSG